MFATQINNTSTNYQQQQKEKKTLSTVNTRIEPAVKQKEKSYSAD